MQVTAITGIQGQFIAELTQGFTVVGGYAYNLLFILATIEIVVFALIWALRQEAHWGQLLFKVIKIGLIAYVVSNFPSLMNVVLKSFATVGAEVAKTEDLGKTLFAPGLLWQYGYDVCMNLLKAASEPKTTIGLAIVQTVLGLGTLIAMAVFIIQIAFQLVAFYFTALFGLLLSPFGVLGFTMNLFEQVLRALFKAAIRVAVIMVILGIAILTYTTFNIATSDVVQINENLGLFVAALLFAYFSARLPGLVASVVGSINFGMVTGEGGAVTTVTVSPTVAPSGGTPFAAGGGVAGAPAAPVSNMAQATMVGPSGGGGFGGGGAPTTVTVSSAQPAAGVIGGVAGAGASQAGAALDAQEISKSISDGIVKQMKESFSKQGNDR